MWDRQHSDQFADWATPKFGLELWKGFKRFFISWNYSYWPWDTRLFIGHRELLPKACSDRTTNITYLVQSSAVTENSGSSTSDFQYILIWCCLINRGGDFTFTFALLKHASAMQHKKRQILLSCYIMRVDTFRWEISLKAGK